MDSDNRYLPVWYQLNNASQTASIICRQSSARQREAIQGVCDYSLYPILKENADILLYNTVWDIVTHPDFYVFYEDFDILLSRIPLPINDKDFTFYRPYLIFPADEPIIAYTAHEFNYPYMVGVFSEMDDIYAGEAGLIEEGDGYPQFRNYLVPEWDFQNNPPEIVYREHHREEELSMPRICNSPQSFDKAVCELLEYLNSVTIDVGIWKERLMMTREMLKTKANELHILHNAGLYDIDSLWSLLLQPDSDKTELRKVIRDMESELHRYAMTTVNLIDWKKGGFNKENVLDK